MHFLQRIYKNKKEKKFQQQFEVVKRHFGLFKGQTPSGTVNRSMTHAVPDIWTVFFRLGAAGLQ